MKFLRLTAPLTFGSKLPGGSIVRSAMDRLWLLGRMLAAVMLMSVPLAWAAGTTHASTDDSYVAIDGGWNHTCAIRQDSTVWCWGDNSGGALGDGTTVSSSTPVQVAGVESIVAISTTAADSCAVRSDGTAWCWGFSIYGSLGDGTMEFPAKAVSLPIRVGSGTPIVDSAPSPAPSPTTPLQEDTGQSGLVGKVYPLPNGQSELPNFSEIAEQSIGTLVAPNVDVPSQDFRTGFPGVEDRIEWFAIRFEGSVVISTPGNYEFKLLSDDGSRLFIDKKLTVDHDGLQASTTATSEPIALSSGAHDLVLEYFQGPGSGIALQLFWKTPGSSEFVIVPPEAFARPDLSPRGRVQISVAENGTLVYSDERVSTSAMAASLRDATSTLTSPGTYSGGLVTILLLALLGIFLEFPFNWVEARAKARYLGIMERLRKAAADPRAPRILGIRIDVILFLILGQVIVQLNAPLALIPPIGQLLQTALLSAFALFTISAWYALPRILLQRRTHGDGGEFRAEWPSLFIALLGLAAAQLSGIVPGFLIGLFTVRKFRRALPDGLTARGTFVATIALVTLGLVGWFALDALDATIVEPTDPLRTIGDGLLGVLLVAGSQGALLNLLDPGDDGAMALRRTSLAQWLAAVGISGLLAFALLAAGKIDLAIFTPPTTVEHYIALLAFAFASLGLIVFVDRLTERRVRRRRTRA